MDGLFGYPQWLEKTIFVLAVLSTSVAVGYILHRRGQRRLAAKRPNLTREDFVALLSINVDADIAEWLWEQAMPYYDPLTPHPNDHLLKDAMIDDDDIDMVWWPEFSQAKGLDEKRWTDWPKDWDPTVSNYARWLQLARDQQISLAS